VTNCAVAEFCDRRHNTLEVIFSDQLNDRPYKYLGESGSDAVIGGVAFVHQEVEQLIDLRVGETKLDFIGLTNP